MNNNSISETGAIAIAQALPGSAVTTLDLSNNRIGGAGATAIAQALPGSAVTGLQFGGNNSISGAYGTGMSISRGGKGALWQAWKAKHGGRAKVNEESCRFELE